MLDESWFWWLGAFVLPLLYIVFLCIHFKKTVVPTGLILVATIIFYQTQQAQTLIRGTFFLKTCSEIQS